MNNRRSRSTCQLDRVDRRILYELMADARARTPPEIADRADVTPGTVRNRIERLESEGVIEGYHAHIDFERTEGRVTTLFMCNVPFAERETIARAASEIPGVVNVRVMMGGRRSFHVIAVGEDTIDLRRIGTTLSELGVEIEDEMLVEHEHVRPYAPFNPEEGTDHQLPSGFIDAPRGSELLEVTVHATAPVAGVTIAEAVERDILDDEPLIVSITRDGDLLTPHGDTTIEPEDVVTVFADGGVSDRTADAFVGPAEDRGGE